MSGELQWKGFASLKNLAIIIKLSLKIFFLVPFKKKKKVFVTHLLAVGNLILSKLQLEPASHIAQSSVAKIIPRSQH